MLVAEAGSQAFAVLEQVAAAACIVLDLRAALAVVTAALVAASKGLAIAESEDKQHDAELPAEESIAG